MTSRDPDAQLRAIYRAFDNQGLGFIRRDDALRTFHEVMPSVKSHTVEEVFDELDSGRVSRDGTHSGRVSCDAFMAAFRARHVM
ncbi:hypothetical protein HYH02_009660 [Chlamydomonas schloesseri]|uniref:EF-hand domain-containing protein n=1 Tax=Chlamydomonas schloesseri TaxID=2026947 RepID=A0A835TED6_9CHLO|nr:hypothetical protein HYH02_009660 [Chlamydomonas schloesseri]|eukprot:KAG2442172.1 hypothetical protein HYH02_009660 [Chlamydomonas schloesseri]